MPCPSTVSSHARYLGQGISVANSLGPRDPKHISRNWRKLTDSRKRAKILADNRKSHHPIKTLIPPDYDIPLAAHKVHKELFNEL